jgi:acetyl esterase
MLALLAGPGAAMDSERELDAGGVRVLLHVPPGVASPAPCLVWIHGGGFVIGSAAESAATARDLAAASGCVVANVDYRLAPEHPFPTPLEDCLTAVRWVHAHAAELGIDPGRIAVAGDSAGGNLSAVLARELKDLIRFQGLVYPVVDTTMAYPSIEENADGYLLTTPLMHRFHELYVQGAGVALDDPRLAPMAAADLSGLPPALVITAEFDPLRDEGEAYGARLAAAGVPTTVVRFQGMIHAFFSMAGALPQARVAIDLVASSVRRALPA